jgi:hypothetical protein
MSNHQLEILQILKDDVDSAYSISSSERKELHELEWDSDNKISILGEAEIIAETVLGLFSRFKKHSITNKVEALSLLAKYSVYNSPILAGWLARDGNKFLHFSQYLKSVESLRMALKEFIEIAHVNNAFLGKL